MTNRAILFEQVQNYMRRSDAAFVAALPTMLLNVESRLADEVTHSSMITVTTLALSGRTVTLPADCVEVRSLTVQEGPELNYVTPEVLREGPLWSASGDPCQYTIENRDIYVAPSGTATLDLSYYARFTAMISDAGTTTLLAQHFPLYLWAMLVEAAKFVQDAELALGFEQAYADKKRTLMARDINYQVSGSALRRISQSDIV